MRGSRAAWFVAIALMLSGCAPAAPSAPAPSASSKSVAAEVSTATSQPGGLRSEDLIHDGVVDRASTDAALKAARRQLGDLVYSWYESPEERPRGLPGKKDALLGQSTLSLLPVYEYTSLPASASTIFAVTRQKPRDYMLVMLWRGKMIGSCDWTTPPPSGSGIKGADPVWGSFYGMGYLDLAEAERVLRKTLGPGDINIRLVRVPRGYWVVGNSAGLERAVCLVHQGMYDDDPRDSVKHPWTTSQMLKYGAPHRDGK